MTTTTRWAWLCADDLAEIVGQLEHQDAHAQLGLQVGYRRSSDLRLDGDRRGPRGRLVGRSAPVGRLASAAAIIARWRMLLGHAVRDSRRGAGLPMECRPDRCSGLLGHVKKRRSFDSPR